MMAPSTAASITEHWLTLMTCTVCQRTPDESPLYLCNLGHTICLSCFKSMTKKGVPQCTQCQSTKFKAKAVSRDFLKKLKIKPGIGRPFRYVVRTSRPPSPVQSVFEIKNRDETVTLEKLFQLPTDKLKEIFEENTRKKMKYLQEKVGLAQCRCCKNKMPNRTSWLSNQDSAEWFVKRHDKPLTREASSSSMCSRKPLNCPHNPCNKIIAMSSFHTHFKHEHPDIPRYNVERGKELEIEFDPGMLEFNTTFCLGLMTVYQSNGDVSSLKSSSSTISNITRKFNQRTPVDTFWIMTSGSCEAKKSHAYVIFWLFTNNDEFYNCTLELASQKEAMCCSTFCAVNGMHDTHAIHEVAQRLNCLYVTFGAMETILSYGSKPRFRVAVH